MSMKVRDCPCEPAGVKCSNWNKCLKEETECKAFKQYASNSWYHAHNVKVNLKRMKKYNHGVSVF